jgi:hypothetical protein
MSRTDKPRAYISIASRLELFARTAKRLTDLALPAGNPSNLRNSNLNPAFRRLKPPASIAVAMSFATAMRVILAPQPIVDLALKQFLHNQPRRQAHQLAALVRR